LLSPRGVHLSEDDCVASAGEPRTQGEEPQSHHHGGTFLLTKWKMGGTEEMIVAVFAFIEQGDRVLVQ